LIVVVEGAFSDLSGAGQVAVRLGQVSGSFEGCGMVREFEVVQWGKFGS